MRRGSRTRGRRNGHSGKEGERERKHVFAVDPAQPACPFSLRLIALPHSSVNRAKIWREKGRERGRSRERGGERERGAEERNSSKILQKVRFALSVVSFLSLSLCLSLMLSAMRLRGSAVRFIRHHGRPSADSRAAAANRRKPCRHVVFSLLSFVSSLSLLSLLFLFSFRRCLCLLFREADAPLRQCRGKRGRARAEAQSSCGPRPSPRFVSARVLGFLFSLSLFLSLSPSPSPYLLSVSTRVPRVERPSRDARERQG